MKRVWKVLLCVAIISSMLLTSVFAASNYPVDIPDIAVESMFTGVENARDIGGYMTTEGRTIAKGKLFRSGNLKDAVPEELEAIEITKIIDLRTKVEILGKKDVAVEGAENINISMLTIPNLFVLESADWKTLLGAIKSGIMETWDANLYRQYIQDPKAIDATKEFFKVVLENGGDPVLWHCTAGKDRTGIEAMLLMAALGCDYNTILKEFLLTNLYYKEKAENRYDDVLKIIPIKAIATEFFKYEIVQEKWLNISMEVMRRMTGESDNDAALQKYLREKIGLTAADINTLKEYYLEPVTDTEGTEGAKTDSINTMRLAPAA